ncbi:MAG: hypothetical protein H6766_04755 [Candidatus Peribacteria bacterium]|nr:MAG: hypothetical protein H6766_04755 [Candidatus Peribacteria bacterium]
MKRRSGDTYQRLQAMEQTTDGFRLAEIDLQYRGAGEILGTRQSGETDIPLEWLTNTAFVDLVRDAAQYIIQTYPDLEELPRLKKYVEEYMGTVLV